MNSKTVSALALLVAMGLSTGIGFTAQADDSKPVAEAKEAGRDMKKSAKKAGRGVKDATCEMVNGKMDCAAKKAHHKMQNAADEAKEKMAEPKK